MDSSEFEYICTLLLLFLWLWLPWLPPILSWSIFWMKVFWESLDLADALADFCGELCLLSILMTLYCFLIFSFSFRFCSLNFSNFAWSIFCEEFASESMLILFLLDSFPAVLKGTPEKKPSLLLSLTEACFADYFLYV